MSYDDLDRPLRVAYSDSTPTATYTYDQGLYGIGRLSSVSNSVASTGYTYEMGRTLHQDKTIGGNSFSMSWAYYAGGLATSYTLPNGTTISQTFDNLGRPTSITSDWVDADHPATLASNFVYHPTGALTSIAYGNGTTSTSYTSGGLLKTLQHGTPSDPGELLDFEYDYQEGIANTGQIMGITDYNDSTKSQTYSYDEFHRLLTAQTDGNHWGLSWGYDRYGNRLSQTVTKGTAPSQSLSIDSQSNRVTGWVYDQAGNTLNDGNHSYSFDANNRITSLVGGITLYRYDADGSRVQKVIASHMTSYFFGVGEYDSALSGWSELYIKLGQEKLVEYGGGTTHFFHSDHRFTPRARTALSGSADQTWDDLPFGEGWQYTGPSTDTQRFTGHLRDKESGNEYAFTRHYSSQAARWLAVDSVRGQLWKPQSLNRFSYSWNDPVNFYDPDGLTPRIYIGHWHVVVPGTIPPRGTGGGHGEGFEGEGKGGARGVAEGGYIEGVPEGEGLGSDPFDLMSATATKLDELEDAGEITSCEALARLFDSSESIYDSRLDAMRDLMEIAGYRKGRLTEFTSTGFRPEFQQLDLDQVHHAIAAAYAGFLGGSRLGKWVANGLEWAGTDSDPDYALNEVMVLLGAQYGLVDSRFPFKPPHSLGLPNLYAMPNGAFGDRIRRTVCEEQ